MLGQHDGHGGGAVGGLPLEADGGRVLHESAQGSGIKTIFYFLVLSYGIHFICTRSGIPDLVLISTGNQFQYKIKKLVENELRANNFGAYSRSGPT